MNSIFIPVFKLPVSYTVAVGRRWSVLEQLLLIKLATDRMTVEQLVTASSMPDRLVVEALINLLRVGWIEVRAQEDGNYFTATPIGLRRAADEDLPSSLENQVRWISLCVERLTGSWLRTNDIQDIVHEKDLPDDALILEPEIHTLDPQDGELRSLLYVDQNQFLLPEEPKCHPPSRRYMRALVSPSEIQGLPRYISAELEQRLVDVASSLKDADDKEKSKKPVPFRSEGIACSLEKSSFIVGGDAHAQEIASALEDAKTHLIIHSCFIQPDAVKALVPGMEMAAKRNVKIDLLWGLHIDPENPNDRVPITQVEAIISLMSPRAQRMVSISQISSGSHAKIVVYDSQRKGGWTSVIGSCNYLSSKYDQIEVSLRINSAELAHKLIGELISIQIPASGAWPPVSRRLNRVWGEIKRQMDSSSPQEPPGLYTISLLRDGDHYACIRRARDYASERIHLGCDLFGLAANTSALTPLSEAAKHGVEVELFYQRPSKAIQGIGGSPIDIVQRVGGLQISRIPKLHGKFMYWDNDCAAISSFNWMSTVVDGSRSRGAEYGVLIEGPNAALLLKDKMKEHLTT